MNQDGGFVDLRVNRFQDSQDSSVWPSFTDIMSVIVMIFLLALVVILVKNDNLVKQLQTTMESERKAMAEAQLSSRQKNTLNNKLEVMGREIANLRSKLLQTVTDKNQTTKTLDEKTRKLEALQVDILALTALRERMGTQLEAMARQIKDFKQQAITNRQKNKQLQDTLQTTQEQAARETAQLQTDLQQTRAELAKLHQQRAASQNRNKKLTVRQQLLLAAKLELQQQLDQQQQHTTQLEQQKNLLNQKYDRLQQQLSSLNLAFERQNQTLHESKNRLLASKQKISSITNKYGTLEEKYQQLIRPARSPEGRFVIEVRYFKKNGQNLLQARLADEVSYKNLSPQSLNQYLDRYKQQHPKDIYIRVVIPKDSGLSYNEAWAFTNDLLNRYDYYYQ